MKWFKRLLLALSVLLTLLVLVLAVGVVAARGDYAVPATASHDPALPTISLNGGVFHFETFGDSENPTLVVVHGGPGADYRALRDLRALADEYFVVFYDQRGTGLSPRVEAPTALTFELYLEDLKAFVEHFGGDRPVHLFGHSFGGMLSTAYAVRYPEKVDKLILAEPGPLTHAMAADGPNVTSAPLAVIARASFEAFHIDGPDEDAVMDYIVGKAMMAANPGYWCEDTDHESIPSWRFSSEANQNVTASFINEEGKLIDILAGAAQIETQTLFLAGSCDTVIGETFQRRQMAYFGDAELIVIDDAGHMLVPDQPQEVVDNVRAFLAAP